MAEAGAIADWLTEQTLLGTPFETLVERFGQKLVEAGVPVDRLYAAMTLLHPQFESMSWLWMPGAGTEGETFAHGSHRRDRYRRSPISHLVEVVFQRAEAASDGTFVVALERFRLDAGEGVERFPIMADLATEGFTDVAIGLVPFGSGGRLKPGRRVGSFASFATRRNSGFSNDDIRMLTRLARPFGAAIKASGFEVATAGVMSAYLGEDAGRRVLAGEIRRGEVRIIDAAILIADLRGFTGLADRTEARRLVEILDAHLEAMAVSVAAKGGQVLKFLGDGLLASFGTADVGLAAACRAAIEAARTIRSRIAALSERFGADALPVDLALHCGPVLYGNVGAETRLDFTVIGPAVNETSRMEQLCSPLGCWIIASDAFVEAAGDRGLFEPIGEHRLRGVARPRLLHTLA